MFRWIERLLDSWFNSRLDARLDRLRRGDY